MNESPSLFQHAMFVRDFLANELLSIFCFPDTSMAKLLPAMTLRKYTFTATFLQDEYFRKRRRISCQKVIPQKW